MPHTRRALISGLDWIFVSLQTSVATWLSFLGRFPVRLRFSRPRLQRSLAQNVIFLTLLVRQWFSPLWLMASVSNFGLLVGLKVGNITFAGFLFGGLLFIGYGLLAGLAASGVAFVGFFVLKFDFFAGGHLLFFFLASGIVFFLL